MDIIYTLIYIVIYTTDIIYIDGINLIFLSIQICDMQNNN